MDYSSIISNKDALEEKKYEFVHANPGQEMSMEDHMNLIIHDAQKNDDNESYSSSRSIDKIL